MSDLTTARAEAQAAAAQIATDLAALGTQILTKEGELAALAAQKAAKLAEHAAVTGMMEAGKIVSAVEAAIPTVEADVSSIVQKVEASPYGKAIVVGGAALLLIGGLAFAHFGAHWL